jgi:hypothetical protein
VVRVLVECCLQEARYNPYYGHLAARLAAVSKGDKVCDSHSTRHTKTLGVTPHSTTVDPLCVCATVTPTAKPCVRS